MVWLIGGETNWKRKYYSNQPHHRTVPVIQFEFEFGHVVFGFRFRRRTGFPWEKAGGSFLPFPGRLWSVEPGTLTQSTTTREPDSVHHLAPGGGEPETMGGKRTVWSADGCPYRQLYIARATHPPHYIFPTHAARRGKNRKPAVASSRLVRRDLYSICFSSALSSVSSIFILFFFFWSCVLELELRERASFPPKKMRQIVAD